jgi:hypothetical protein
MRMKYAVLTLALAAAGTAFAPAATADPFRPCEVWEVQCTLNCLPQVDTSGGIKNVEIRQVNC